jgi:ADP-ribosylglycohydrolase
MSEDSSDNQSLASADQPARRHFISSLMTGTVAASTGLASATVGSAQPRPDSPRSLFDKLYGCLAGVYIGSAMGVPVESWTMERIAEKYGLLTTFQPHRMYGYPDPYPPGTTEDGTERVKYLCLAIIGKQDRITADDLVKTWLKVIDTDAKFEAMKKTTTAFDRELMAIARTGAIPAAMIGTLVQYSHLNATIRCFAPIAMINACDPDGAVRDLYDVARVYQPLTSDGYPWGACYNAALAHAFRPDATVNSVIDTALAYATNPQVKRRLQRALDIARKNADPMDMRKDFLQLFSGRGPTPYHDSYAEETGPKALAVFAATKGNFKETIILSVNFGRDTDCLAAGVGALAGALSGASSVPPDWIRTVDEATKRNPVTNSQLTIRETTEGIYRALQNKVKKMKEYVTQMDPQLGA